MFETSDEQEEKQVKGSETCSPDVDFLQRLAFQLQLHDHKSWLSLDSFMLKMPQADFVMECQAVLAIMGRVQTTAKHYFRRHGRGIPQQGVAEASIWVYNKHYVQINGRNQSRSQILP
jgi:hypothetical protein